jgi:hypothetical protein
MENGTVQHRWWGIVALMVIAYAVWWKLVDKSRLSHLLLFGSLVTVMRVIFEDAAVGTGAFTAFT